MSFDDAHLLINIDNAFAATVHAPYLVTYT